MRARTVNAVKRCCALLERRRHPPERAIEHLPGERLEQARLERKIDRKALPAPSALRPVSAATADIVMTDPQRRVAAIWREVLRVEQLGVDDNFFDRGGHSLLVVKLHAALRREFQRERIPFTATPTS